MEKKKEIKSKTARRWLRRNSFQIIRFVLGESKYKKGSH